LYITIVWNCLSNVYVPFFLLLSLSRARWTRTTVCEFEALYNHVLKSENICIYIYGILPEFSVLIKSSWECLFSLSLRYYYYLKNVFSTLIRKANIKNRQNLLPSKVYVRRIEQNKSAHKMYISILYLNLQIKNFLALILLVFISKIY
jgi:hypothetical protein